MSSPAPTPAAPPSESWDVIVVGAGPAGSSAALAALEAQPGLRVLLLDRADFPRDKCCGDGLAPLIFEALAEIGVVGLTDGWEPVTRLELSRSTSTVAGTMARPVWVIPRTVFDARLVERAVAAGAVLRRHRVHDVRVDDTGAVVDCALRCRVLIAADGAHSAVRTALGTPDTGRRALAIRGYAPTPPGRAARQVIAYGDRRQPSYAWSFDRGDGLSNVGYGELLDAGEQTPATRIMLLEQLERLLPGATADASSWRAHHLPLSGFRWSHPSGPVLYAGDAAGLVNPMTGEGIYYAVATGLRAGRAAASGQHAHYATDVRRHLGRHLRHTTVASRLSRSSVMVDAGIDASARRPRVFDDLVEIGLGRGTITPRLAGGLAVALARRSTRPATPATSRGA